MLVERQNMASSPTTGNRIHLAVSMDDSVSPALLKTIAETAGMTAYDAKLRLHGGLPKSLVCCPSIEEAEAKAAILNGLGLLTIVYEQNDLPPAEPLHAMGLTRTKAGFRIRTRREEIVVAPHDISLLVYGRRMFTRETRELKSPIWHSPSQVMTTGVTMALSGSMHVSRYETSGQHFLMLFGRVPHLPAIEISQEGFGFQCLGRKRGHTRQESLLLLVAALRKLLPDVPFNDRLMQGQSNNRGEPFYNRSLVADSSSANATLLYWQMIAEQSGRRHFTARWPEQA
jgi:hypothetical protein